MQNSELQQSYAKLATESGYFEAAGWTVIQMTGEDRVKFLQSFCTADVAAMAMGEVREGFVLNGKGKTLGHLNVLKLPQSLLLVGPGDQAGLLMQHLDMYIIRDDVQLENLTESVGNLLVAGGRSEEYISKMLKAAPEPGNCQKLEIDGVEIFVAQAEFAGNCFWLGVSNEQVSELKTRLDSLGCIQVSEQVLNMYRLEQGTPWYGCETTLENLPQELNRDDQTISFTKGCYLGQETVARIDSLGRVNKLLVRLHFAVQEPTVGQELIHDGKVVGKVTSVSAVPGQNGWRGLAFVKRDLSSVGSTVDGGVVETGVGI